MEELHFFTDIDKIIQYDSHAFGPVLGSETTAYNLCGNFILKELMDATAYAAVSGKVLIQPVSDNSELVNILLYPFTSYDSYHGLPSSINYFIYRGIRKDSILGNDGNIIGLNQPNNTELTQLLTTKFNEQNNANTIAPSSIVGYQYSSLPDEDLIDKILNNEEVEIAYAVTSPGMIIGRFHGKYECGFQVILKNKVYLPTLEMWRNRGHFVIVPEPSFGVIPGNESFEIMKLREEILNFMDPAVLFMGHEDLGVAYRTSVSSERQVVKGVDSVYNSVVSKFFTRNRLYVDIRNENGYSLNFYKDQQGLESNNDFGEHLYLIFRDSGLIITNYYSNYWPILIIEPPINTISNKTEILISFRKDYCQDLILYIDQGIRNEEYPFFAEGSRRWMEDNGSNLLSETFEFAIPNVSSIHKTSASLLRLYYLRHDTRGEIPNTVLKRERDLDNLFSLYKGLPDFGRSSWVIHLGKKYFNAVNQLGIAGMADTLLEVSDDGVWFIARISEYYKGNVKDRFENNLLELDTDVDVFEVSGFHKNTPDYNNIRVNVLSKIFSGKPGPGVIKNLSIGVTKEEYLEMISTADALPGTTELFLQFGESKLRIDKSQKQFIESKLRIAGLQSNGSYTSFNLSPSIYTLLFHTFTSFLLGDDLNIESAKELYISVDDFIDCIKSFEREYSTDTPHEMLTRIRVHFYGFPGNGAPKGYLFNLGVPNSPYYVPFGLCLNTDVPPYSMGQCIIRKLDQPKASSSEDYKKAFNKIVGRVKNVETLTRFNDNETLVLIDNKNNFVDVGHSLYGLDSLISMGPNGKPGGFFSKRSLFGFGLDYSIDFASFVGDIAWALASAYYNDQNPTEALNAKFIQGAPSVDLFGDADAFGLKLIWDELIESSSNDFKLSDILVRYYKEEGSNSFKHRWRNFGLSNQLIKYDINNEIIWNNDISVYNNLKERVVKFGKFAFYANNKNKIGQGEIVMAATTVSAFPFFDINFADSDVDVILNKFFEFVKEKIRREKMI